MARRRIVIAALSAALLLVCLRLFVVALYAIPSPSMVPTLLVGDRVLVRLGSFEQTPPARGEVVVFRKDGIEHVKRVVGLPGERIEIVDRRVVVDAHQLPVEFQEPRVFSPEGDVLDRPQTLARSEVFEERAGDRRYLVVWERGATPPPPGPWIVPEGQLFVLGDNRTDSVDSRSADFGFVPLAEVVGRATRVLFSTGPKGPRAERSFLPVP